MQKALPSPCTASSHAFSVNAFRRTDHVTQNASAARNNDDKKLRNRVPDQSQTQHVVLLILTGVLASTGNFCHSHGTVFPLLLEHERSSSAYDSNINCYPKFRVRLQKDSKQNLEVRTEVCSLNFCRVLFNAIIVRHFCANLWLKTSSIDAGAQD